MERCSVSWIGKLTTVMMAIIHELMYNFNAIQIKIPAVFFAEIDKLIIKFIRKYKGTKTQTILKNNKVGVLNFLVSKLTKKQ